MKKYLSIAITMIIMIVLLVSLSSCGNNSKITSYYINEDGNLIAVYDDSKEKDLGEFGKDIIESLTSVTISEDGYYVINGVKTNISAINVYNVTFDTGFSTKINSVKVKDGYKVERPSINRDGYTLNGWYCNGEEWRFNSDVVKNDMTLTAEWIANEYTVSFINEKGDNPTPIVVAFDSNIVLPTIDDVDGYTFSGWYNGNTKVVDGKWKIASDVTLTAKWSTNEYSAILDANGGEVSKSTVTVKYGEKFTLPIPTNSYGVFTGWLYNGEKVTDKYGESLNQWTYNDDVTFTVDWTIKVYTVEDLKKMNEFLNGEFILMNDIDLNGVSWNPVGNIESPFTGSLFGNGYRIKNLSINTANYSNKNAFGLFGYISNAKIQNINIVDFNFTSENLSKSYSVGAVAGTDLSDISSCNINDENDSLIKSIRTSGTINTAKQSSDYPIYAGGIIGKVNYQLIYDCSNSISLIEGSTYAGGIIGYSSNRILLFNCSNTATIASSVYAGGLVGRSDAAISASKSYNSGNITSVESSGGIVGSSAYYAYIELSYNSGNIISTSQRLYYGAGGIIGSCYTEQLQNFPEIHVVSCYNTGNINSPHAGGILGGTYTVDISNCYNSGTISGSLLVAGIAAIVITGKVKQCYVTGNINSGSGTKGIIIGTSITVADCYHTFNSTSGFSFISGTYTSQKYGSSLYINDLFWTEYNPSTNEGTWVFNENDYPKLYWEI